MATFRINRWLWLFLLGTAGGILTLSGLLRPLGDGLRRLTLPLVGTTANLMQTISAPFIHERSQAAAEQRVRVLESRLAAVSIDYVRLHALEEENKTLSAQAKFLASSGYDSLGAHVISRDVRDNRAWLLIDRGLNDQLEIGQAVVTDGGIFIGKVKQVKERVASVELLSDASSRVAAANPDTNRLAGVVEGRGNGAAVLSYIPSSEHLHHDQILMTAGTEDKVPGNLPFGIVNIVQGKSTDPFLTAVIEPLTALNRVMLVSVLRPAASQTAAHKQKL